MIQTFTRVAPEFTGKEEVVVVPIYEGDKRLTGTVKKLDVLCRSTISAAIKNGHFVATRGETLLTGVHLPKAPQHVLLLGIGPKKELNPERAAIAGGSASRYLRSHRFKTCHILLNNVFDANATFLKPFLKGFVLAQYRFFISSQQSKGGIRKLVVMTKPNENVSKAIRAAGVVAEHNIKVRDLVNLPADILTPSSLAAEAKSLCNSYGVSCSIMGPSQLKKIKMGAVLSVARGSQEEPRFITMHYNKGKRGVKRVCLVGKGVTFDSGGISIKPWQSMNEMKGDMAGAALVISTVAAAARLKIPLEIIGLVPAVENMPDGVAFRPGDVITTYSGKTIEILSTDAEGRLILSDALSYSLKFKPDVIVDFATLTGAVVIALGTRIAGAMGNSQHYIDQLIKAGKATGELVWQLPLDDVFLDAVKGDISDYKNYAGKDGSTITAAALLGEFVGETPWVHLDIAGTFWSDGGRVPYHSKGATGYGVDLTLRFLESVAKEKKKRAR
jgi:leucyl aminopeptidase